jgi:hypothetical protein
LKYFCYVLDLSGGALKHNSIDFQYFCAGLKIRVSAVQIRLRAPLLILEIVKNSTPKNIFRCLSRDDVDAMGKVFDGLLQAGICRCTDKSPRH